MSLHPYLMLNIKIFFFHDTATTEIYTLSYTTLFRSTASLLPRGQAYMHRFHEYERLFGEIDDLIIVVEAPSDRKSTRLNSSHPSISYAVFCLKKKKIERTTPMATPYVITHCSEHHPA